MTRRRAMMIRRAESGGALPGGYTQLSYLQSNGTQYINTEYLCKHSDTYDIGVTPITTTNNQTYIGNRGNDVYNIISLRFFMLGTNAYQGHAYLSANVFYALFLSPTMATINGVSDVLNIGVIDLNLPVYLFCCGLSYTRPFQPAITKLHYARIYDNGVLVRDMLPAQRDSDSVLGMYDTVNNTFYTNAGIGTFSAG